MIEKLENFFENLMNDKEKHATVIVSKQELDKPATVKVGFYKKGEKEPYKTFSTNTDKIDIFDGRCGDYYKWLKNKYKDQIEDRFEAVLMDLVKMINASLKHTKYEIDVEKTLEKNSKDMFSLESLEHLIISYEDEFKDIAEVAESLMSSGRTMTFHGCTGFYLKESDKPKIGGLGALPKNLQDAIKELPNDEEFQEIFGTDKVMDEQDENVKEVEQRLQEVDKEYKELLFKRNYRMWEVITDYLIEKEKINEAEKLKIMYECTNEEIQQEL